nr:DUF3616 domain-containing protein [uncultured Duganella sp.]
MATTKQAACVLAGLLTLPGASATAPLEHHGMCDASAGIAVDDHHFVVANDEDNVLRVYRSDRSGAPVRSFDMTQLLRIPGEKQREADIEGAALIGRRIYWIASHGANKKARARPERRQLFATDIGGKGDAVTLTVAGQPYTGLLDAIAGHAAFKKYHLHEAAQISPEDEGGLNIEGLAATPEGHLLIGLRSPVVDGKALLLTLKNPDEVLGVGGAPARAPVFGAPIELPLGGLGIRSIDYADKLRAYLIVAGPRDSEGVFKLYKWAPAAGAAPAELSASLEKGLRPEGLFALADGRSFQLLSDDGDEKTGGVPCKEAPPERRRFRSITVRL